MYRFDENMAGHGALAADCQRDFLEEMGASKEANNRMLLA